MSHATTRGSGASARVVAARADALSRAFEKRLRALERAWPGALDGDPDGVHDARVASRRLREALPIARAVSGEPARRARREARRITRLLGGVREIDVAVVELVELARPDARVPHSGRAVAAVRRHLETERDRRRAALRKDHSAIDLEKLRARVRDVAQAVGEPASAPAWQRALADRGARRAREAHAAMDAAGALYAPDRLHKVRIALKKLRYALELSRDVVKARVGRDINGLRDAQDLLGHLHDLQILALHIDETAGEAAGRRDLSRSLTALHEAVEAECRQLHADLLVRMPALKKLCERVNTAEALAGGRRRPVKMKLESRGQGTDDALAVSRSSRDRR